MIKYKAFVGQPNNVCLMERIHYENLLFMESKI